MEANPKLSIQTTKVPYGIVTSVDVIITANQKTQTVTFKENDKPINTDILLNGSYQYHLIYHIEQDDKEDLYGTEITVESEESLIIYSDLEEITVMLNPILKTPPEIKNYLIKGWYKFENVNQFVTWYVTKNISNPPIQKLVMPLNVLFEWEYYGSVTLNTGRKLPISRVNTGLTTITFSSTQYIVSVRVSSRNIDWRKSNASLINVNVFQKDNAGNILAVKTISFKPMERLICFADFWADYNKTFLGYYTAEYFFGGNNSQTIPETRVNFWEVVLPDLKMKSP